jgi:hypothetical protein
MVWAEDRAPWRHDLSAVPGTETEEWRQEAALHSIFGIGTNALNRSSQLFVNQWLALQARVSIPR